MSSSIQTKQIDGDVAIGHSVHIGGAATVRGSAKICHDLTVEGWLNARNIRGSGKGLYESLSKLNESYPNPHNGWYALVGDTLPADLYIAVGGVWVATGKKSGEPILELGKLTELSEQLDAEESARLSSDSNLEQRLSEEEKTRSLSVEQLKESLDGLEQRLSEEEKTRSLSVEQLKESLDGLEQRLSEEESQSKRHISNFKDSSTSSDYMYQGVNSRDEAVGTPIRIPRDNSSGGGGGGADIGSISDAEIDTIIDENLKHSAE